MTFAEAAVAILEEAGHPLHFREITQRAMAQELVEIQGLTPWNSMNGALRRMIRAQPGSSPVVSLGGGRFALRSWNLPGEEILTGIDEDDLTNNDTLGTITYTPRIQQDIERGMHKLMMDGVSAAKTVANLMVPVTTEYQPLHSTLSTILGTGLVSVVWGLGLAASRKPTSMGLADTLLTVGLAESAAAVASLHQLSRSETEVSAGQMSMRQVSSQMHAYDRVLGYGTTLGFLALGLGLFMQVAAPSQSRSKGAAAGLISHGLMLGLMTWRAARRACRRNR